MALEGGIKRPEHHEQLELCNTRPAYRQGRKLTAVKVYTINDESQHLMICGVPKLQLRDDLARILAPYGEIKKIQAIAEYPSEEFTETFHCHFRRIQSARIAKRLVDGKNFYGGILHVFYSPERESLPETRSKLAQRRKDVAVRIKRHREDPVDLETAAFEPLEQFHRKRKYPALPLTESRWLREGPSEVEKTSQPSPAGKKEKNYLGRRVGTGPKAIVERPEIGPAKMQKIQRSPAEKTAEDQKPAQAEEKKKVAGKKKRIVMRDSSSNVQLVRPSKDLRASIKSIKLGIRNAVKGTLSSRSHEGE